MEMIEALEQVFSQIAKASWHGALLAIAITIVLGLVGKRLAPRWRHALWILLLVRLACPELPDSGYSPLNLIPTELRSQPAVSTAASTPSNQIQSPKLSPELRTGSTIPALPKTNQTTPTTVSRPQEISSRPIETPSPPLSRITISATIAGIWFLITVALLSRLLIQNARFNRQIQQAAAPADAKLQDALRAAGQKLGTGISPQRALITASVRTPCLFGLFRPRLLFPAHLSGTLSDRELEWICLHELAHLQRRDLHLSWIESLLQCVHWFNPIVWFAFRRIRADRELATDDLVLRRSQSIEPKHYGETILNLLQRVNQSDLPLAGVVGIAEDKARIRQRLEAIAAYSPSRRFSIWILLTTLAVASLFMLDAKPQSAADPKPEEPAPMRVQVLDYRTQSPIPNGTLEISAGWWDTETKTWNPSSHPPFAVSTDGEGRATIQGIPKEANSINIIIEHPEYLSANRSFGAVLGESIPSESTLEMIPPVGISGRVKTPSGDPIPDAKVQISFTQGNSSYFDHYYVRRPKAPVQTDSSGRWSARAVPESVANVTLFITHDTYAVQPEQQLVQRENEQHTQYNRLIQAHLDVLRDGNYHTYTTTMHPGGILRGTVLHHLEQPIPQAEVVLHWTGSEPVITNDQGEFEVPYALVGPVNVVVNAKGYSPFETIHAIHPAFLPQAYHLGSGSSFTFRIVDLQDRPIEKVRIQASNWKGNRSPMWSIPRYSDSTGAYVWSEAPTGPVDFAFYKDGYRTIRNRTLTAEDTPHLIQMEPDLTVNFEVTDEQGRSIPNVQLLRGRQTSPGPTNPTFAWRPVTHWWSPDNEFQWVGESGHRRIVESEPAVWGSQTGRIYRYRVEAPGYRSETSRIVNAGEYTADLKFTLRTTNEPPRRLELPSGDPIPNQRLWLLDRHEAHTVSEDMLNIKSRHAAFLDTDADGKFIPPDRDEPYQILGLLEAGFVLAPNTQTTPFVVQPWASIEGIWTEGGQPATGLEVALAPITQARPFPFVLNFSQRVTVGQNGEFRMTRVPPREITLVNWLPIGSPSRGTTLRRVETQQLTPGRVRFIEIKHPKNRTLTGRIEMEESVRDRVDLDASMSMIFPDQARPPYPRNVRGNPEGEQAWLQMWLQTPEGRQYHENTRNQTRGLYLDPDGSFSMPRMLPGRYRVEFQMYERSEGYRIRPGSQRKPLAHGIRKFVISDSSPTQVDLGTILLATGSPKEP